MVLKINLCFAIVVFMLFITQSTGYSVVERRLQSRKDYLSEINELISELRKRMCRPIPELGLPSIDPFTQDLIPFDISDENLGSLKGEIRNLAVKGFRNLVVTKADISTLTLKFVFEFGLSDLNINAEYNAEGDVSGIPINGPGGDANIYIQGIKLHATAKLKKSVGEDFKIEFENLKVTFDKWTINVQGLTQNENLNHFLNGALTLAGPELLEELWPDLEPKATEQLKELIDDQLKGVTVNDILGIINGGEGSLFPPLQEGDECIYDDFQKLVFL